MSDIEGRWVKALLGRVFRENNSEHMNKAAQSTLPNRALFHADSLDMLRRIQSEHVQLIYLDPPSYENYEREIPKSTFADYLHFLAPYFSQSRRILHELGNLVLHFDPFYLPYARIILDEIFGQDVFKNEFIIPVGRLSNQDDLTFDTIVVYRKSSRSTYNKLYQPYDTEEISRLFPYEDNVGRYRLVSLLTTERSSSLIYEWKGIVPPKGKSWRFPLSRMNELAQSDQISFSLSQAIPSQKIYLKQSKGKPLGSIWNDLPRFISADERTGYETQQPLDLLWRIIRMFSNRGDKVCDPFCGSGTTLIAAEFESRNWLGCDNSKRAIDVTLSRLKRHFRISDFRMIDGNTETLKEVFGKVNLVPEVRVISAIERPLRLSLKQKRRNRVLQPVLEKPLIITEGKTDWKHIKAAFMKFRDAGYIKFDVDFDEFQVPRGDDDTLDMCEKQARLNNHQTRIFIFDRDVSRIVKNVSGDKTAHKNWGNNVYSFAIPLPEHRLQTSEISIEFYYQDKDLIRKDHAGRRLFLSDEFNSKSGRHLTENINCTDLNKLKGQPIKIIDDRVFDDLSNNVALSKEDFANYIYMGDARFNSLDIYAFTKLFELIAKIMRYPEDAISIPVAMKAKRHGKRHPNE